MILPFDREVKSEAVWGGRPFQSEGKAETACGGEAAFRVNRPYDSEGNAESASDTASGTWEMGRFYYRLALGAAVRRDIKTALGYAYYACLLDSEHEDAAKLLAICRQEKDTSDGELEQVRQLAGEKKWLEAARAGQAVEKNVRLLSIQGCLFAIAGRDAQAIDCFAHALEKDGSDRLAASALAELRGRKKPFFQALRTAVVAGFAGLRRQTQFWRFR
jgi:tetratricopeptide (TPR) repeat protein